METIDLAEPWRIAERDLAIRITAPFRLPGPHGHRPVEFIALVHEFGGSAGTLLMNIDDALPPLREATVPAGYFISFVNLESYARYDRQLFIDTLNDWGYFGSDAAPSWYTGEPWNR
jgi:hypothetical protein